MPKTYTLKFINNETIIKIKGFSIKPNFEGFKEKFYSGKTLQTENQEWGKKETDLNSLDKRKWSEDLKNTSPLKIDTIMNGLLNL